jgi:uncharacterized protein (DUF486 family)
MTYCLHKYHVLFSVFVSYCFIARCACLCCFIARCACLCCFIARCACLCCFCYRPLTCWVSTVHKKANDIIIIIIITYMQGIYNYITETNRIFMVYSIAPVPFLQLVLHVMLFRMLNIIQCSASSEKGSIVVVCTVLCGHTSATGSL